MRKRELSDMKKFLFYCSFILWTYLLCELLSFLFFAVKEQQIFSFSEHQSYRLAISNPDTLNKLPTGVIPVPAINFEVIHPYLGFVKNPREMAKQSEYGFPGKGTPFSSKTEDNLIIGIFGGSFAAGTSMNAKESILHELRQIPEFSNKEIIVHTVAMGGYKQPQQLLALTYFLTLGAHFDIVINLDGFNEVTLAPAENANIIYPFYPRGWAGRVGNFIDPKKMTLIAEISFLDTKMKDWANIFANSFLRYNITANLIWRYRHINLYNNRMREAQELEEYTVKSKQHFGYMVTGPSFHYETETDMFKALVDVWKMSSLNMYKLCTASGIHYFHFLQPNQYVPGSKIMQEEELEIAFQEDQPYRNGVIQGYPLLREEGRTLRDENVNFHDLTMIFQDNPEPLYADNCCHVNEEGYHIIGTTIGKTIAKYFQQH